MSITEDSLESQKYRSQLQLDQSKTTRIQGLDVLRGFAILLVLLRHSWPAQFGSSGIVGVTIFFTLSGYLITGVLLRDFNSFGKVHYRRFYRNRAIRLLPALFFFLLVLVIIEGVLNLIGTRGMIPRSLAVALSYTANIPGFSHGSPSISHLWTLANEEQFYLIWPIIMTFGLKWKKLPVFVILSSILMFFGLFFTINTAPNGDLAEIYTLPTSWTIAMIIGVSAQLAKKHIDWILTGPRASIVALAATAVLVFIALIPNGKSLWQMYIFGGPCIGLLSVCLILKLQQHTTVHILARPLFALGTISYAAYIWNWPIFLWTQHLTESEFQGVIILCATILAATTSWFLVEKPANRLKNLRQRTGKTSSRFDPPTSSLR